jgi:hypothetical protein
MVRYCDDAVCISDSVKSTLEGMPPIGLSVVFGKGQKTDIMNCDNEFAKMIPRSAKIRRMKNVNIAKDPFLWYLRIPDEIDDSFGHMFIMQFKIFR